MRKNNLSNNNPVRGFGIMIMIIVVIVAVLNIFAGGPRFADDAARLRAAISNAVETVSLLVIFCTGLLLACLSKSKSSKPSE